MLTVFKTTIRKLLVTYLSARSTGAFRQHPFNSKLAQETVMRLQDLLAGLPAESHPSEVDNVWRKFQAEMINQIADATLANFLRLPVIQATMYESYALFLYPEYFYLRSHADGERIHDLLLEDSTGGPIPFLFDRRTSGNLVHHVFHLIRFEQFAGIRISEFDRILEFGGGYGSLCRVIKRAGFSGNYFIKDLPCFSLLQRYYLRSIGFAAELQSELGGGGANIVCFNLYTPEGRAELQSGSKRLFIATWSLSEVGTEVRDRENETVAGSNYFLIAFRDTFEGYDNLAYFDELIKKRPDIEWSLSAIDQIKNSYYLFGRPRGHTHNRLV